MLGRRHYTDLNSSSSPCDREIYAIAARKTLYSVGEVKNVSDSLAVHGENDIGLIEHGAMIDGPKQCADGREDSRDEPSSLRESCSRGHSA